VWEELELNFLPDKSVHIARFGREGLGVLEVNELIIVQPTFHHHQFFWVSKLYVPVVLLYSGLNRLPTLSAVHLITLKGYAVHPWGPQLQVVLDWTEVRYLPKQQTNILLRQPYVIWTYDRKVTKMGLSLGFDVFTVKLRAHHVCLRLYLFSLQVDLRNANSSWKLSLSHTNLAL
jgi:hypothetical protein